MRNKKVLWMTQTAIFIALLIVVQFATKALGQFVTGSCVNLILITAGLTVGLWAGVTVALISPVFAFFLGIGPAILYLLPVVMLGNLVIVVCTNLILSKGNGRKNGNYLTWIAAITAGAIAKFLVLWLGVVKIVLPLLTNLKPQQVQLMSAMFSWPQLVTALIGGVLAMIIVPLTKKAVKNQEI